SPAITLFGKSARQRTHLRADSYPRTARQRLRLISRKRITSTMQAFRFRGLTPEDCPCDCRHLLLCRLRSLRSPLSALLHPPKTASRRTRSCSVSPRRSTVRPPRSV